MSSSSTIMPCPAAQNQEREDLILAYLDHVSGMLRRLAASTRLEYEDLKQDAVIVILHCLEVQPQEPTQLHRYITRSVHNGVIHRLRKAHHHQTFVSLNTSLAEISEGGDATTFADLLESPDLEPLSLVVLQEQLAAFQTWLHSHKTARGKLRRQLRPSWQRFLKEGQQ